MKAMLRTIDDHGTKYEALMFVCPGCDVNGSRGLHMLPVNSELKKPSWSWDGNLELPTLSPSILTKYKQGEDGQEFICHCFLKAGIFQFLSDCTHELANQHVPIPDLYQWVLDD